MKLIDHFKIMNKDLCDISKKEMKEYIWIVFDLETTGLIGGHDLKLISGKKYYDENEKKMKNEYLDKDLEIAEIGAFAYNPKNKKRFSFHKYLKADLSNEIKTLISWDDIKQNKAKEPFKILKKIDKLLGLIKNRKKIIIAHNGNAFDFKIMSLIGDKYNLQNIKDCFYLNKENTILIDTKDTKKLREKLNFLNWPFNINEKTNKQTPANNLAVLLEMFQIKNIKAHTAIEDVVSLCKYLIKILRLLK